jgi:acetyltransferase-like isoleucine patch superfamily enzyme
MISPQATVCADQIGQNVTIHEYAVVRSGVVIGNDVIIHPHVVIEEGVSIGNGVEIFPGTYIGKKPRGAGATARPITFESRIAIGDNCAIGPNAVIYYDVEIGHNTLVGDGASIREQVRVGHHCIISRYVTINYNTVIGDRTKIMDLTHITGNCVVGDDVFISVLVSTANDNIVVTREFNEELIRGPVIADRAIIGSGASVLPAVVVGEGAMIGAGSVVTKDVAPDFLAIGVPARAIKSLRKAISTDDE